MRCFSLASFSAMNSKNYRLMASKSSPWYVILWASAAGVSFSPILRLAPLLLRLRLFALRLYSIFPDFLDILRR